MARSFRAHPLALRRTVRHEDYGAKRIGCDAYDAGSTDNIGVGGGTKNRRGSSNRSRATCAPVFRRPMPSVAAQGLHALVALLSRSHPPLLRALLYFRA